MSKDEIPQSILDQQEEEQKIKASEEKSSLASSNSRNPKFSIQTDVEEVANLINLPHEDYPYRVRSTEEVINTLLACGLTSIDSRMCRMIHAWIFADQPFAGKWRDVEVKVGNFKPMSYVLVPNAIENIFPIHKGAAKETLMEWYKKFETIHPFQDGNGRVGGVIIAVMSEWDRKLLTPDNNGGLGLER